MNLKFPVPKATNDYERVVSKGFELYPKRYENFINFKSNRCLNKVDYMPIKIDIEPLSRCNLKCDMCIVSSFPGQKRAKDLSLDSFKKIIDENYGLFEIKIQGLGEPFLHKDFIRMVEYASSKYVWTRSTTNGTFLHKDNNYRHIIDANIGELQISIDGCTKESYERIRVNANFETVVQNAKLINEYQKYVGCNKTRMWFVLQDFNFDDLMEVPYFAKELGFERVTISFDLIGWNTDEWEQKNRSKSRVANIKQKDIDLLLEIANIIEIDLSFWGISKKYTKENLCPWPFERSFISSDEFVLPCCIISNPNIFNFGKTSFEFQEIWNGSLYEEFRQAHLNFNIPEVCKFCYEGF